MDPLNPHCGTHVPWVNTKKQLWHRSSSVCTEWTHMAHQRRCARLWKGDWVWGEQGIVFEVLLLSERQKRHFESCGIRKAPQAKEMHSFSQLFHQYRRKEEKWGERRLMGGRWGWRKRKRESRELKKLQLMWRQEARWTERMIHDRYITNVSHYLLQLLQILSYAASSYILSCRRDQIHFACHFVHVWARPCKGKMRNCVLRPKCISSCQYLQMAKE